LTYDNIIGPVSSGDAAGALVIPFLTSGSIEISSNTTAGGALTWNNTNWGSAAAVQALYGQARPVSGEIYAEFIGSTLNDQGYICAFQIPRNGSIPTTIAGILALPYTRTYPLREGVRVLWKPEDNRDMEFIATNSSGTYPSVGFIAVGLAGVATQPNCLKLRLVFNFEGIPLSDQSTLVNASPSPIDLSSLERASRWGSDLYSNFMPFTLSRPNLGAAVSSVLGSGFSAAAGYAYNRALRSANNIPASRSLTYGNAQRGMDMV